MGAGGRLRGPLEVVSSRALEVWAVGHQQCEAGGASEDERLQRCLHNVLGVPSVYVPDLLAERKCFNQSGDAGQLVVPDWMDCTSNHSAFYPLQTKRTQERCIGMIEAITPNTFGFGRLPSDNYQ